MPEENMNNGSYFLIENGCLVKTTAIAGAWSYRMAQRASTIEHSKDAESCSVLFCGRA
jgi:hypothetical protein